MGISKRLGGDGNSRREEEVGVTKQLGEVSGKETTAEEGGSPGWTIGPRVGGGSTGGCEERVHQGPPE